MQIKRGTHKTWTPNMDPQYGPQYGPPYGPPSNGVNSFESSIVNIRIDFENTVKPLNSGHHWFSEKVSAIERCPL